MTRLDVPGLVIDALATAGVVAIVVGAWSYDWRAGVMVLGIGCLSASVALARR